MWMFRRKRTQRPSGEADGHAEQGLWTAEMTETFKQMYGVQSDDLFTAVLIGRRVDGPGNGIMKYTLSVHGPGHQYVMVRLRLGLIDDFSLKHEVLQRSPGQLPGPLGRDIPVVMPPYVLKSRRTTYDCRPDAERVLTSKGWRRSDDWVTVIGQGRWFNGDHGSWAAPVVKSGGTGRLG